MAGPASHARARPPASPRRQQLEVERARLRQEMAARDALELELKKAFLRGVTALNIEAMHVLKRGHPPGALPVLAVAPQLAGAGRPGQADVAATAGAPAAVAQQQPKQQQQQQADAVTETHTE